MQRDKFAMSFTDRQTVTCDTNETIIGRLMPLQFLSLERYAIL